MSEATLNGHGVHAEHAPPRRHRAGIANESSKPDRTKAASGSKRYSRNTPMGACAVEPISPVRVATDGNTVTAVACNQFAEPDGCFFAFTAQANNFDLETVAAELLEDVACRPKFDCTAPMRGDDQRGANPDSASSRRPCGLDQPS